MAKTGRPRIELDSAEIEKLCRLNCTMDEIAAFFGCSTDTIERRMKEDEDLKLAIERGRATGKISLRRKQFQILEDSNSASMAIWLGKQLLGQRDNLDVTTESKDKSSVTKAMELFKQVASKSKQSGEPAG